MKSLASQRTTVAPIQAASTQKRSIGPLKVIRDNRPQAAAQRKLQAAVVQRMQGTPVAQRTEMDDFVKAYEAARHFHNCRNAVNLPLIEENGLLNYEDRCKLEKQKGIEISGMSALSSQFDGDEKKGVFMGNKTFRLKNDTTLIGTDVRLFLDKGRATKEFVKFKEQLKNPDNLFFDSEFPGGLISPRSIPADNVSSKTIQELLDQGDTTKIEAMLAAVATHYPQGATVPSLAAMKVLLRQAIVDDTATGRPRRLSNASLDNRETWVAPS